jgi:hypothetical protein
MTRAAVALAVWLLLLALILNGTDAFDDLEQRRPDPAAVLCMEDQPCWDCSTMGNLICGPTTTTNKETP